MHKMIVNLLLLCLVTACGTNKYIPAAEKVSPDDPSIIKKLYAYYNEWRGVKYLEGGMSKKGVDCSGFVKLAYKSKLNKDIPRSTELMSSSGVTIKRDNLQPGDVLFFKTGWKIRHVGIYAGRGKFMHASSSNGVMMSKLNNPYWLDAYWMARRF